MVMARKKLLWKLRKMKINETDEVEIINIRPGYMNMSWLSQTILFAVVLFVISVNAGANTLFTETHDEQYQSCSTKAESVSRDSMLVQLIV